MPDLTGLWLTNVTPFTAEGAVDYDAFSEHVAWLVDNGVERFVPAGNTGEYSSLDAAEVVRLTELTRESAPKGVVVAPPSRSDERERPHALSNAPGLEAASEPDAGHEEGAWNPRAGKPKRTGHARRERGVR